MANYDFSTLNSTDLENLVCDLLNFEKKEEGKIQYKTFKEGKDKGIDFLYSSDNCIYDHIGQVKHYYRTGYDGMLRVLKNTELSKVQKLNPKRYIFATSVDLSVSNTEEIKNLFCPYVKNLNDVYGKTNLNQLIDKHDKILELHYKLWLGDFKILKKIYTSGIEFRSSAFCEDELKKRIRLFVETKILDEAKDLLEEKQCIIIIGEPGVGKTTLAEMIIYNYISRGYNLSYVYTSKELEDVIIPDDSEQIIYFDDFLGSTKYEINEAKQGERFFRKTLTRLSSLKNKYLIMTTRTHLLTKAKDESENLDRVLLKYKGTELKLDEYNNEIKRSIVQNHKEESEVNADLLEVFDDNNFTRTIVTHKNFTPRLIEFITTSEIVKCETPQEYRTFIKSILEYPEYAWKHAYLEQINDEERLLLNTLFSFGTDAFIDELKIAFEKRIDYEVNSNNFRRRVNVFDRTLSRLNGSYIKIDKHKKVQFINPSLIDFLEKYLKQDSKEINIIILCTKYVSQLTGRLFSLIKEDSIDFPDELKQDIINNYREYLSSKTKDQDLIRMSMIIQKYIKDKSISERIIYDLLEEVDSWEALYDSYDLRQAFNTLLSNLSRSSDVFDLLNSRVEEILDEALIGNDDIESLIDELTKWKHLFELDFYKINTRQIIDHLDSLFSELIFNETEWLRDWATDESEYSEKRNEIAKLEEKINDLGIDYSIDFSEMDKNDWFEICSCNDFRRLMEKDD